MDTIQELIKIVQCLILAGAAARAIYICAVLPTNPDEEKSYKARLRNLGVFVVLAETIGGLVRIIAGYF